MSHAALMVNVELIDRGQESPFHKEKIERLEVKCSHFRTLPPLSKEGKIFTESSSSSSSSTKVMTFCNLIFLCHKSINFCSQIMKKVFIPSSLKKTSPPNRKFDFSLYADKAKNLIYINGAYFF